MLNGVTKLIMTKADVLSGFDTIEVCTHYNYRGETIDYLPYGVEEGELEPVYESVSGWQEDLTGLKSADELPETLSNYVDYLEKALETPIAIVSVGPDRSQTLIREAVGV